jgi:putative autoinducer-2 (AI-2) aldolase
MPVLAITAVGKKMNRDLRYLSLCCRIAAEYGAHIVKTYYCEGFEKLVASCPVPIVIAGGKKLPEVEALTLAYRAVSSGAAGVDMGRNIFQSEYPVAMIQATRAVVHDNRTPDQAFEMFQDLSRDATPQELEAGQTPDF